MIRPQILILAGQREGVMDPLCAARGVTYKADVPVAGVPMLSRVMTALDNAGCERPFYVSGYEGDDPDCIYLKGGAGPADSVFKALEDDANFPVLVTTCDHALLNADMITEFLDGAADTGADFCAGVATESVISAAYPDTKRTYIRFSDHAVSGCNLFYIANTDGLKAILFWRDLQHLRKNPLKMARKIGVGFGLRMASGRLSLSEALSEVSQKIKCTAKVVYLSQAEAAIDVDKPSDLDLVEAILAGRDSA